MILLSIKYVFSYCMKKILRKIVHKNYNEFGDQFLEFGGDTIAVWRRVVEKN